MLPCSLGVVVTSDNSGSSGREVVVGGEADELGRVALSPLWWTSTVPPRILGSLGLGVGDVPLSLFLAARERSFFFISSGSASNSCSTTTKHMYIVRI